MTLKKHNTKNLVTIFKINSFLPFFKTYFYCIYQFFHGKTEVFSFTMVTTGNFLVNFDNFMKGNSVKNHKTMILTTNILVVLAAHPYKSKIGIFPAPRL